MPPVSGTKLVGGVGVESVAATIPAVLELAARGRGRQEVNTQATDSNGEKVCEQKLAV